MESSKRLPHLMLFIVTLLIILYETMTIFQGYFGAYPELALFILAFFLMFPMKRETFDKLLPTLIIVLIFMILQSFTRIHVDSFTIQIYNILKGCFVMVLPVYLVSEEEDDMLIKLFWVTIIAISITEITTLINIDPNSVEVRELITGRLSEKQQAEYARLNIGGFDIAYLTPVITTLLFALYKNKKLHILFLLAHILLSISFMIRVQFTLALLIYFVTLAVMFLSNGKIARILIIVFASICLIPLIWTPILDLFTFLADKIEGDVLSQRFEEIAKFMAGSFDSDSDIFLRLDKYNISLKFFGENILGGGVFTGAKHGGHSAILDFLAVNGLIGIVVLFFAFRSVYIKTLFKYKSINTFNLISFAQVLFFIYALVNQAFYSSPLMYLFFLSTGACVIINRKGQTSHENTVAMQHSYS